MVSIECHVLIGRLQVVYKSRPTPASKRKKVESSSESTQITGYTDLTDSPIRSNTESDDNKYELPHITHAKKEVKERTKEIKKLRTEFLLVC